MPKISNQRIVPFPAEKIFQAVMDIESYPQILHFIRKMEILEKGRDYIIARVSVGLPALTLSYDCRIEYNENKQVKVRLACGLFQLMDALWT